MDLALHWALNTSGHPVTAMSELASDDRHQIDVWPGANGLQHPALSRALHQARRDLLDPSRRNRLLHAPLTGKRPWCMEIIGHDIDAVFDVLCRQDNFRGYAFKPLNSDEQQTSDTSAKSQIIPIRSHSNSSRGGLSNSVARLKNGRPYLQSNLARDNLDKRLTKIFRDQRMLEEEQGLSTLYLALGFLKWLEAEQSDEFCFAPLILVPVTVVQAKGPDRYLLQGRDDDVVTNFSLQEKLRSEFDFSLPDIPEDLSWTPSAYCEAVKSEAARHSRWEVRSDLMGLGFFSFSKFMMWRDLDASTWPQNGLSENRLLNILVGENTSFDSIEPLIPDDEPIDKKIDISKTVHVVDADSSQSVVIEEAMLGRNLVVQGPPGTGKSQTITNIIAATIHSGKTVLFVAEKAAALGVVHDRLARAGLGPLCLEMHSRKANKRPVLKSLDEALRISGAQSFDAEIGSRLASCRDQLNTWSNLVHKPIGQTGRTAFQVIGRQLQLRADNVRLLPERLDEVGEWSADLLASAEMAADRAASTVARLGCVPSTHPWYGTNLGIQNPFDCTRLTSTLGDALTSVGTVLDRLKGLYSNIIGPGEPCLADALAFVRALRHLLAAPAYRSALVNPVWTQQLETLMLAIDQGERLTASARELASLFSERAWTVDATTLLLGFKSGRMSLFGRIGRPYRQSKAVLRAICRGKLPRSLGGRLSLVQKLEVSQQALRSFGSVSPVLTEALGPLWANLDTKWQQARNLAAWVRTALSEAGGTQLVKMAAETGDLKPFAEYADILERAGLEADKAVERVCRWVDPDLRELFDVQDYQRVPLRELHRRISNWLEAVGVVNDWVGAREALSSLRAKGLGRIADDLVRGELKASEARPVADLLISEALWRRAVKEAPELATMDGVLRSDRVAEFRDLDQQRIQLSRQQVLARYLEQRPSGYIGEMGIIRGEIEKKRGHRTIRRLMQDAGAAVQRLKPIFLMSPLSVAQFIPPGRLHFDLLVIDEASQVAPEDALGAIARAGQIVVVGDHQQLPPTNFFKATNSGSDEQVDDESAANITRASDYESILTLSRSRGMSERMLAWHYRSRHPSLIALSNQECYAGRLLLPPSPFGQSTELGLSLVRTPRGFYDRGQTSRDLMQAEEVAKAIEKHVREYPNKSLGVACLSAQQRDAVDDMIDRLGIRSAVENFSPANERLFVKNLEAVQGDERDTIFISVGYGVAHDHARPFLNFGPVSRGGGERRLNVLASRAREKCVVFSSITAADIPADTEASGTRMLRALLHFAETGKLGSGTLTGGDFESPFEDAVARAIVGAGYRVVPQVGVSSFRIDLGVINPVRPGEYLLGVECDGATYHRARSVRDRDRLRQEVLENLGWRLHRIWSTDWFRDPHREAQKLLSAIGAAQDRIRAAGTHDVEGEKDDRDERLSTDADESVRDLFDDSAGDQLDDMSAEYKEYPLTVPRGRDLLELSVKETSHLALAVVEAEGPVHTDEIARRIREAFGLQRTGRRILKRIEGALIALSRSGMVQAEHGFWWIQGREIRSARTRRTVALPLRRAQMISPVEYRLVIMSVLEDSVSATREDVAVATARRFGFDRMGAELRQEIMRHAEGLIAAGKIASDGVVLRIPAVSA